jgi:glycosyltransferase involved in cell wall biosynthesis
METHDESPLRLLVVAADTYPPFRVDVVVLFGEELAGRGHHIDWILQSEQACAEPYVTSWGGGRVWVGATDPGTSVLRRLHKHWLGIRNDLKLFGLLRHGNYDLVQVKDKFIAALFAMIAARVYRKRFVYWLSYPFPEASIIASKDGTARYPWLYRIRGEFFRWLLYRLLLPAATHVFVQSEQMRRDVAAEGVPLDKMTAVPMGIRRTSISEEAPGGERQEGRAVTHRVLYLGTLDKTRRLDFLIRVFARVRTQVGDAQLYLVGRGEDPTDEAILVEEARRLGVLDDVVFLGQRPQAEALQYVREADVCVSPFYPMPVLNSTSPTKLVEYMAMGKAVVANDHPEQRLLIAESGGGLCVPYDEEAFAAAVVRLLRAPLQAREMGLKGRAYVLQHRAYGRIADRVERQFLDIVAQGGGS